MSKEESSVGVPFSRTLARLLIFLLAAVCLAAGQKQSNKSAKAKEKAEPAGPVVLQAMEQELSRSMEALHGQSPAPYFLSYEITEAQSINVSGSFGAVTTSIEDRRRVLDVDLRVGDYKLDNTHEVRGSSRMLERAGAVEMPVDDSPAAIRNILWYETDKRYKRAAEQFTRIGANVQVTVENEEKSADFSPERPEKYSEPLASLVLDRSAWENKIRQYTAAFAKHGDLYEGHASLIATAETRWYVNSEGAELQTSQPSYRLMIYAVTRAADGMELPRYEAFLAFRPEGLPDDRAVLAVVDKMISDLDALRKAPVTDPYSGPAILSGRASGVFFHEVFGHRVEGSRQKLSTDAQTFKKMVNEKVLPEDFSVIFDPTLERMAGHDLAGYYRYDNQGVKGQRVVAVENGVFKNFLMSRTPIEGFPASNGHGRKQAGFAPVARQSNLVVSVAHPVPHDRLKQMLIEEVTKQGKPYGLLFDDIQGGFTMVTRVTPNAFNVMPVMVYRVYPDGREELVRGVDFIGTPLNAFSSIVAGDDRPDVFNGTCGAESGGVPVSGVSPAVLVRNIEVQKKAKSQERLPILPMPAEGQN